MPYIGYNTVGSTFAPFSVTRAYRFTAPEAGTVDSIEFYVHNVTTGQMRGAIFATDVSADTPTGNTLLGDFGQTAATGAGWAPFTLSPSVALTAGAQYWVVVEGDGGGNVQADIGVTSDFTAARLGSGSDDSVAWASACPDRGWANTTLTFSLRISYTATPANLVPSTPTLTVGDITPTGATLTGSAFSDPDAGDSHSASQWQITTAADTGFASPVLSTGDDASNLTSYAASGLTASTNYLARVRYKDTFGPAYSSWSIAQPFTTSAANAPPVVEITSPPGDLTVPAGTKIIVEFTATDPEDGNLASTATVTSDNTADGTSGALGTGSPLTLDTTGMAAGTRRIAAKATDSGGLSTTASFALTIGAPAGVYIPEEPMQVIIQAGVATTVPVPIFDPTSGAELDANPFAPGDAKLSIDGTASVVLTDNAGAATWPCINSRVHVPISAAQATGRWNTLRIRDQDASPTYKCPPVDLIVVDYDPTTATTAPGIASLILADPDAPLANDASGKVSLTADQSSVTVGTVSTLSDKTGFSLSSSQTFSTTGSVGSVTGAVATVSALGTQAKADVTAAVPTATAIANATRDIFGLASSVADSAPTATSFVGAAGLSAVDDFYKGMFLVFDGGTLDGVGQKVTGYVGATRTFTVAPAFPATPANGDPFILIGRG